MDLQAWIDGAELEEEVVEVLKRNNLLKERTLLLLGAKDIERLKLKKGDELLLIDAVSKLQIEKGGGGPCVRPVQQGSSTTTAESGPRTLDKLLADLSIGDQAGVAIQAGSNTGERDYFKIVDFLPKAALQVEDEIALGGGVHIKLGSKPKLEKVTPAMWVVANSRIQRQLMMSPGFDAASYLRYTEMVGEMACRFTWLSVLLFDDEYRQRQAAEDFKWGTDAPHLSTVTLRDRASTGTPVARRGGASGNQRGGSAASGREYCRQWNRGACSYGQRCNYEHACSTCGKDHAAKDHTNQQHA